MYACTYDAYECTYVYLCVYCGCDICTYVYMFYKCSPSLDIIISLKSGNSTDCANPESSLNLTPNNLSNSNAIVPVTPERTLPVIFDKLRPGQFGPKGRYIHTYVSTLYV